MDLGEPANTHLRSEHNYLISSQNNLLWLMFKLIVQQSHEKDHFLIPCMFQALCPVQALMSFWDFQFHWP